MIARTLNALGRVIDRIAPYDPHGSTDTDRMVLGAFVVFAVMSLMYVGGALLIYAVLSIAVQVTR